VPRSRELLQRFRLAGTPGAAAVRGVPADRAAEATAELEPVLARLAEAEQQARAVRAAGQLEAARRRQAAAEHARSRVDAARQEADEVRAEAFAEVRRRAAAETTELLEAADREAALIRSRTAERMPAYVDRVVAAVRAMVLEPER